MANIPFLNNAYFTAKVGIGTASPLGKLHVKNVGEIYTSLAGSDSAINFLETGGNPWRIGNRSADDSFRFSQDSSSLGTNVRVTFANGGNVGIGTTSPEGILHIAKPSNTAYDGTSDSGQSNIGASVTIMNTNTTVDSFAQINMQVSASSNRAVGRIVTIARGNASSDMAFVTESFGVRAEKMRIDQTGNVGIGTTSPSYRLTAYGSSADSEIVASFGSANDQNEYTAIGLSGFIASNGATKAGLALKRTSIFGTGELHFLKIIILQITQI